MSIDHLTPSSAGAAGPAQHAPGSGLIVRSAIADEAPALSALAMRSKGWWGYSASFLRLCEAELTLSPEQAVQAVVVEVDGVVAGFHLLDGAGPVGELDMLFVDPPFIGTGIGRILFEDARRRAIGRGWTTMHIEADQQARTFYERLGAEQIGERLSASVPGHSQPLFAVTLRAPSGGGAAPRATYWR